MRSLTKDVRLPVGLIVLALVGMAYTHVVDAQMKVQEHVWYMLGLFCCNIAASLLLLVAVLLWPRDWRLWAAASALAVLTIACYVWSRTVGFPQMADHIGDWGSLVGNLSLAFEAVVALVGWLMTRRLRGGTTHLGKALALGLLLALLPVSSASAHMEMVGQMSEYPNPAAATPRNRQAVSQLLRDTSAAVAHFDTTTKAEHLGYSFNAAEDAAVGWPAVRHMRKNGSHFWGKVLVPTAPQALLWWCLQPGQCTLIGVMYRAQPEIMPPTYGGILQWHKHGPSGSWMTHLWLTHDLRSAFARCVPFAQLAAARTISQQSYKPDVAEDVPCGSPEAGAMGS